MRMRGFWWRVVSLALVLALAVPWGVWADVVVNDLDTTIDPAKESVTIASGGSVSVGFYVQPQDPNDPVNGCNATGAAPAVLTITPPTGVSVSPSTLTFTSCGTTLSTTFSSSTAGSYDITGFSLSGGKSGGTFNTAPAQFTLNVAAPADTTAPVISYELTPAAPDGENGWYVSDVLVEWTVSDPDSTITSTSGCDDVTVNTDTTGVTYTCSATSAGGTASVTTVTIKRDATAPTISASLDKSPAASGWFNGSTGAPTVSFTCSDATSGVVSCPSPYTFGDGADQSHSATVYDNAGNSASDGVTDVDVDLTGPVVTVTPERGPDHNGWYNAAVVFDTAASDAASGVDDANCSLDQTYSGPDGSGLTVSGSCTDNAGNVGNGISAAFNYDATAPVVTVTPERGPDHNGWYNSAVVFDTAATDATSGVDDANCSLDQTYSGPDGTGLTVSGSCTDNAGNVGNGTSAAFKYDATAPVVTVTAKRGPDHNGWYNAPVDFETTGVDATAGIASCTADQTYSGPDGIALTVSGSCIDEAGNVGNGTSAAFKYDATAPTISAALTPDVPASGWYNIDSGAPTVTYTCGDVTAGIASCPVAYTFGEGENQSHSGTAYDNAGNSASDGVTDVDVDLTAPTITWNNGPVGGGSYYFGFVPAEPTCTADDSLSGAASCVVTGYGTGVGTHVMSATAYDNAGNKKVETRTYTVLAWTLNGFYRPVEMGKLNTVKGGSTVPLKFNVYAGSTELTDVSVVASFKVLRVSCADMSALPEDPIDVVSTGGTVLRYDATGGQFIQNWQTPRIANSCWIVTMTTDDGSKISADFKLK